MGLIAACRADRLPDETFAQRWSDSVRINWVGRGVVNDVGGVLDREIGRKRGGVNGVVFVGRRLVGNAADYPRRIRTGNWVLDVLFLNRVGRFSRWEECPFELPVSALRSGSYVLTDLRLALPHIIRVYDKSAVKQRVGRGLTVVLQLRVNPLEQRAPFVFDRPIGAHPGNSNPRALVDFHNRILLVINSILQVTDANQHDGEKYTDPVRGFQVPKPLTPLRWLAGYGWLGV